MNNFIDTAVIGIFSIFLVGIGILFIRTGRNLKSFFAGGEAVPWSVGGLSLFMSFFSAGTFVAWGSIAYKYGWVSITIQWTMCIGAIITGLFLASRWKQTRVLTAAEFVKARLGNTVQKTYIYIFILVSVFIKGTVLYPVARLVSSSLGFPLVESTIVLGLFMIAYTAIGGLWAVMVTDILQFVVLTAAVFILLTLSIPAAGGTTAILDKLPSDFFQPLNGEYTIGFILAFLLYHICYIGGNWTFVQRYTSVESPAAARKVAFLFAGLYLISPVIWMIPPMIYRSINPGLEGLETENAYLLICQLVLPPGLLGLMLTGMYFSTSASANTALNVVSAVFTNDIYKGFLNPSASDRQLIRVARLSSWAFGIGMILIALTVPYIGGLVNVVLSVAAVTGGPLLAPPLWALFSRRLTGRATWSITMVSLLVNLYFKVLSPGLFELKLSRAMENIVGVGLPLLLLAAYEAWAAWRGLEAVEYQNYQEQRRQALSEAAASALRKSPEAAMEEQAIRRQNHFGLRVIAFSLVFTGLILLVLSFIADRGRLATGLVATLVLLSAWIPYRAAGRVAQKIDRSRLREATAALGLILLLPLAAAGQSWSLNGDWAFRIDPENAGERAAWFDPAFSVAGWDQMAVPGNWDLRNEYAHYAGKAWYRRGFSVPASEQGKAFILHFEGVYHDCSVWFNGRKLGENHSGFLEFEFDVTEWLRFDQENVLVVCADNTFRRGAMWNWGGIRRPVKLQAFDGLRIVRQHITPTVDLEAGTGAVQVKIFIQNFSTASRPAGGEVQLQDQGAIRKVLPFSVTVPPRSTAEVAVNASFSKAETRLWHFDAPYLYRSVVQLSGSEDVSDRFGFRKVELDHQTYTFKLNGEPVRLLGYNLVADDRSTGNTLPLWRIKEDVDLMKSLGGNLARLSHQPLPKDMLDYLDERGMLIFSEIPLWGIDDLVDPAHPAPRDWLRRLVTDQYNHPSIIGWCVGNEIGYNPKVMDYVRQATEYARQLDPGRMAVMVSHSAHNRPDPLQFSDFGLINKYAANLGPITRQQHEKHPEKTLFYTEFGIGQMGENLDTDLDAKSLLDSIRYLPYLSGASLWTFNDYRSGYTATKERSENRPWGLVDVFRQKKKAYFSYRQTVAPVERVILHDSRPGQAASLTLVPRKLLDWPSYTLRHYRCIWHWTDAEGRLLDGGFATLPELRPGSAAYTLPLSGQKPGQAAAFRLELLSPLQYSLYDTTIYYQKPPAPKIRYAQGIRNEWPGGRKGMIRIVFKKSALASGYKARYGKNALDAETPLTQNHYIDITNLEFGQSYQFALFAVNGAGESSPSAIQTLRVENTGGPPLIYYVEPAKGGFFVSFPVMEEDYVYQLQYSPRSGDYENAPLLQTAAKGVLRVNSLENGRTYFFRMRRITLNHAHSPWSEEHQVVPDGGLPSQAPLVYGVLRSGNTALLHFSPVKKATGYEVQYRSEGKKPGPWQSLSVPAALPQYWLVEDLNPKLNYRFRICSRNESGSSDFSIFP